METYDINDTLNAILKVEAMKCGLCNKWTSEWTDGETKLTLIDKYKRGQDFCIENHFPNNSMLEHIKNSFGNEFLKKNHIYINEDVDDGNFMDVATIVQGDSCGTLRFSDYDTTTIYVRDEVNLIVNVSGNAIVMIRVYDKANVEVIQSGNGKATVKRYGENAVVTTQGNVKRLEKK